MRISVVLGAAAIAAATLIGGPSEAKAGSWCITSQDGGINCGFSSYRQCQASARGNSVDTCQRNHRAGYGARAQYRRHRY